MLRLTPTNDTDREKLAALRIERFRAYHNVPHDIRLSSLDNALIINGKLKLTEELVMAAWLICNAAQIKIYHLGKLIAHGELYNQGWKGNNEIKSMAIATTTELDQNTTISPAIKASKTIRSMALADIAADLEAPIEDLKAFLEERNTILIDFQGQLLVPENEAVTAYEHYSLIRARQKMQERFSQPHNQQLQQLEEQPEEQQEESSPNSPKNSIRRRIYLTWKGSFKVNKTSYKKTLLAALEALFPSQEEQDEALIDIGQKTDLGKAIVDKISREEAYTNKSQARESLFKAAEQLAQAEKAAPEATESSVH